MEIKVVVMNLDGNRYDTKMTVNKQNVEFMGSTWEVKIYEDHVYLFTEKIENNISELLRIRLYSKDNLFTGELRKKIENHMFELINFLKLPEHVQFPDGEFSLQTICFQNEWKVMFPNEKQTNEKKNVKFSWEDFLERLEIDKMYAQKFNEDEIEIEDLKNFVAEDFAVYIKDFKQRKRLFKYCEDNLKSI
jgi:hypothetical protein